MQLYGKLAQNWQEKRQKDKPQTLSTLRVRRWTRVCRRKLIEEQNSLEHLVHLSSCTFGGENNGQPGRSARFKETKMQYRFICWWRNSFCLSDNTTAYYRNWIEYLLSTGHTFFSLTICLCSSLSDRSNSVRDLHGLDLAGRGDDVPRRFCTVLGGDMTGFSRCTHLQLQTGERSGADPV